MILRGTTSVWMKRAFPLAVSSRTAVQLLSSTIPEKTPTNSFHSSTQSLLLSSSSSSSSSPSSSFSFDSSCSSFSTLPRPTLPHVLALNNLNTISTTTPSSSNSIITSRPTTGCTASVPVRFYSSVSPPPPPPEDEKPASMQEKTKSIGLTRLDRTIIWLKDFPALVKHEAQHYWTGTKLLAYEVKTCAGLVRQLANGHTLSRREKRQLLRTGADLLRLVPFIIIVIIPFMELALPILLKLFPNMLPSTYQDSVKKEEDRMRQIKAKVEVAKFLQSALHTRARSIIEHREELGDEFSQVIEKIKDGSTLTNKDIIKFARMIEDDFTLDNLPREHLILMSKFLQLNTFGTNGFLRHQIHRQLQSLKKDDKMIQQEGIESLTLAELQSACLARGIRLTSKSKPILQERLAEWLELSLDYNLPGSILVYANAIKITANSSAKESLREALYTLNDSLLTEIKLKVSESSGNTLAAGELKLQILKKENEQIAEEHKEKDRTDVAIRTAQDKQWITEHKNLAQSSNNFSSKQLRDIASAVNVLVQNSALDSERQQLLRLKDALERRKLELSEAEQSQHLAFEREQVEAAEESLRDAFEIVKQIEVSQDPEGKKQAQKKAKEILTEDHQELIDRQKEEKRFKKETKEVLKLEDRLESLVDKLNKELHETDQTISDRLRFVDRDADGVVSVEELTAAMRQLNNPQPESVIREIVNRLDTDKDGQLSLQELQLLTMDTLDPHDDLPHTRTSSTAPQPSSSSSSSSSSSAAAPAPVVSESADAAQAPVVVEKNKEDLKDDAKTLH